MKLLGLVLSAACLAACQTGSITMTGTARPAISPDEVRVYAEPPLEYDVIALLESAPGSGWTQQSRHDDALNDLKIKAASLGANGILLTGISDVGSSSSGAGAPVGSNAGFGVGFSQTVQALLAKAIYVKREKAP